VSEFCCAAYVGLRNLLPIHVRSASGNAGWKAQLALKEVVVLQDPASVTIEIDARDIEHEGGYAWVAVIPEIAPGDDPDGPRRSTLELFEDGLSLGTAHSIHDDIRTKGCGKYSHWRDALYFSTSDNGDPRHHRYTVKGPPRQGYVPPKAVLRGYEVIPSFLGHAALSAVLLDEMERHPEVAGKASWGTRNLLHALVLSVRPKAVLEIGAHIGSTSVVIGTALKANRFGRLYCLEPQDHYFKLLCEFVQKANLIQYVTPIKLYSTAPEISSVLPEEIDLIYLDANHSYSHALADLELCDRLLADNGLVVLDDVGPEVSPSLDTEARGGVRQALLDFTKGRDDLHVILMEPPTFWLNPCGLGIVCKQRLR
jgi:predicted O-methyltransferase YrrM